MRRILLLFILTFPLLAGPPVIFKGNSAKFLVPDMEMSNDVKILTGALDPSLVAVDAIAGSIYISTNGKIYQKQDAGLTTNWTTGIVLANALQPGGVIFADATSSFDTDVDRLAWDGTNSYLNVAGGINFIDATGSSVQANFGQFDQVYIQGNNVGSSNLFLDATDSSISMNVGGASIAYANANGLNVQGEKEVRFYDADDSNYIGLKAETALIGDTTFTLPIADGASGQSLITDGAGTLSFGSPAVESIKKNYNKAGHGFSVGEAIFNNAGVYDLAQANAATSAEVLCLVSNVIDVDNFECTSHGYIGGLAGLSAGESYFLSESVPGGFTNTEPLPPNYSKPLFVGISATEAIIQNYRGLIGASGGGSGTLQDAYDNGSSIVTGAGKVEIDDLDFYNYTIISPDLILEATSSQISFNIAGASSAYVNSSGMNVQAQKEVRFYDADDSDYLGFRSPAALSGSTTLTLPDGDGSNGQALTTNGSGVLSWSTVGSATTLTLDVNQVAHGFSALDLLYNSAGTYALAQANAASTAEVFCIVSNVIDVDNFTCVTKGMVSGFVGLTAGETYFLSDSVAGDYTSTEPLNPNISKPVLLAHSTTEALFTNLRGLVGDAGTGVQNLQDAYDGGNTIVTGVNDLKVDNFTITDSTISAPSITMDATGTIVDLQIGSASIAQVDSAGLDIQSNKEVRLNDADNSDYVGLKSPAAVTSITYTLPGSDDVGDFLQTDGSGVLSFARVSAISERVAQAAHTFTLCEAIRHNGTSFTEAQADSSSNAEVYGIVSRVIDANNFEVTSSGYFDATGCGLSAGTVYFLSAATAGLLTATEPSTPGEISLPLVKTKGANDATVFQYRGRIVE